MAAEATLATPLVKVIVVALPKATAVLFLPLTVGTLPLADVDAPENVNDLSPV